MPLRDRETTLRSIFQTVMSAALVAGCTQGASSQPDVANADVIADAPSDAFAVDATADPSPDASAVDASGTNDVCRDPEVNPTGYADVVVPPDGDRCAPQWTNLSCGYYGSVVWPCGLPAELLDGGVDGGGNIDCNTLCAHTFQGTIIANICHEVTARSAQPYIAACGTCCLGRRPDGLEWRDGLGATPGDLPSYLALCAALEAVSVPAFVRLRRELRHHGAPEAFVRAAGHAARDEVRHARTMGRLARAAGAKPIRTRVPAQSIRSLESIAHENAVEGCVNETWAALLAHWQSARAQAPGLADVASGIAEDETRHAALSWDVHAWAMDRLDEAARTRVERAMRTAVTALGDTLDTVTPPELRTAAGLPDVAASRRMYNALRDALWARRSVAASVPA